MPAQGEQQQRVATNKKRQPARQRPAGKKEAKREAKRDVKQQAKQEEAWRPGPEEEHYEDEWECDA